MRANKCGGCHSWAGLFQTWLFTLKQWRLGETHSRGGFARRGGQRTVVLHFLEHQRLRLYQTALAGKGQKPCYKLCFSEVCAAQQKISFQSFNWST